MEYTVVYTISVGDKNTRFLIKDCYGAYFSIKVPSGELIVGDTFCSDEDYAIAKDTWVSAYENYVEPYPRSKMLKHLIWYKHSILGDYNEGTFRGRKYSHSFDSSDKNLIMGKGDDEILMVCKKSLGRELRSDFSHLSSSQAFAVNLLAPLVHEGKLQLLDDCFSHSCKEKSMFEYVVCKDEKTQFDFFSSDMDGCYPCSLEIKYSEPSFGASINDSAHLDKFNEQYENYMKELTGLESKECPFFEYYQVWRNLIYTIKNKGQHICFLFPSFRKDLSETLMSIFEKCKEEYRKYFHIVIADNVVQKIISGENEKLRGYYTEFSKKYLEINDSR